MGSSAAQLVAEIKTLYGRRREEKLQIQRDMVALRDEYGWTQPEIAKATGIPQQTVSNWLEAHDEATNLGRPSRLTPASVQAASDMRVAGRVLADAPMEAIEQQIAKLPPERQQRIAAAAGSGYHKARVEYAEQERDLTHRERTERDVAADRLTLPARQAAASFTALGIVGHLDQARDELHEITADGSLTPKLVREIGRALDSFKAEMQVACGLVGVEWEG